MKARDAPAGEDPLARARRGLLRGFGQFLPDPRRDLFPERPSAAHLSPSISPEVLHAPQAGSGCPVAVGRTRQL